jgi:hypothetical protein
VPTVSDRSGGFSNVGFAAKREAALGRFVENRSGIGAATPGQFLGSERPSTAAMAAVQEVADGGKMIATLGGNVTVGHFRTSNLPLKIATKRP